MFLAVPLWTQAAAVLAAPSYWRGDQRGKARVWSGFKDWALGLTLPLILWASLVT